MAKNFEKIIRQKDKALGIFGKAKAELLKVVTAMEEKKVANRQEAGVLEDRISVLSSETACLLAEQSAVTQSIQKIDEILKPTTSEVVK